MPLSPELSSEIALLENAQNESEVLDIIDRSHHWSDDTIEHGRGESTHRLDGDNWIEIKSDGTEINITKDKTGAELEEHNKIIQDLKEKNFAVTIHRSSDIIKGKEIAKTNYEEKLHLTIYKLNGNKIEFKTFDATLKEITKIFQDEGIYFEDWDDENEEPLSPSLVPTTPNDLTKDNPKAKVTDVPKKTDWGKFFQSLFIPTISPQATQTDTHEAGNKNIVKLFSLMPSPSQQLPEISHRPVVLNFPLPSSFHEAPARRSLDEHPTENINDDRHFRNNEATFLPSNIINTSEPALSKETIIIKDSTTPDGSNNAVKQQKTNHKQQINGNRKPQSIPLRHQEHDKPPAAASSNQVITLMQLPEPEAITSSTEDEVRSEDIVRALESNPQIFDMNKLSYFYSTIDSQINNASEFIAIANPKDNNASTDKTPTLSPISLRDETPNSADIHDTTRNSETNLSTETSTLISLAEQPIITAESGIESISLTKTQSETLTPEIVETKPQQKQAPVNRPKILKIEAKSNNEIQKPEAKVKATEPQQKLLQLQEQPLEKLEQENKDGNEESNRVLKVDILSKQPDAITEQAPLMAASEPVLNEAEVDKDSNPIIIERTEAQQKPAAASIRTVEQRIILYSATERSEAFNEQQAEEEEEEEKKQPDTEPPQLEQPQILELQNTSIPPKELELPIPHIQANEQEITTEKLEVTTVQNTIHSLKPLLTDKLEAAKTQVKPIESQQPKLYIKREAVLPSSKTPIRLKPRFEIKDVSDKLTTQEHAVIKSLGKLVTTQNPSPALVLPPSRIRLLQPEQTQTSATVSTQQVPSKSFNKTAKPAAQEHLIFHSHRPNINQSDDILVLEDQNPIIKIAQTSFAADSI